jgi:Sulfotransferase family
MAIGGTGGSGTRVVAHVLRELGFHIGEDLNYALDNLWFTLLFRRPQLWGRPPVELEPGIRLFEQAMRGEPRPSGEEEEEEEAFLAAAVEDLERQFAQQLGRDGESWTQARVESLQRAAGPRPDRVGWGWKQPCTHFFLGALAAALPGLRYIHLLRNGHELAGKPLTRFQLDLWGRHYGVDPTGQPQEEMERLCLRFWERSNEQALAEGRELLGERFLVLRYESICADPGAAVAEIANFAGVEAEPDLVEELAAFVVPAGSGVR